VRRANGGTLSEGQLACMSLVAQNLTSKEIACRLGISPHTVDQRVRQSLRTLGVTNRRQAARLIRITTSDPGFEPAPLDDPAWDEDRADPCGLPAPFATAARPTNTLTILQRLMWIVIIAAASMIAAFMYLAGLESLTRMIRR
jgi:DNA-binding CsgD family transcriptional regulator